MSKTRIAATIITIIISSTFVLLGFIVYLFPEESAVCLLAGSAFGLLLFIWKIVFNCLNKGGEE
jgi:uncharacterized membrane protein (UPF0136 family)